MTHQVTPEQRQDRLGRLAQLLEDDAGNDEGVCFNMTSWGKVDNARKPVSCGSQACAAGLAAISGVFAAEGLGWKFPRKDDPRSDFLGTDRIVITLDGEEVDGGERDNSFRAAQRFFGLTEGEAFYIFIPEFYGPTLRGATVELQVADRIRSIMDGKGIPSDVLTRIQFRCRARHS